MHTYMKNFRVSLIDRLSKDFEDFALSNNGPGAPVMIGEESLSNLL